MAEDSKWNTEEKETPNDEFYESWSSTQIQVVKIRHTWTITNFSLCCQEKGEGLESPTFSAGSDNEKLEWRLKIYPKGDNSEESKNTVSLFLSRVKGSMNGTETKFKCGIVNANCERVNVLTGSYLFKSENGRGWINFINQECLFDKKYEYLLDDKLTIFCEIIAGVGSRNISGTLAEPHGDPGIDFTFLFENKYLSDVIILSADDKEFPAHKVILTARSPVFKVMFQHDMEESRNNRVKITDIDEEGLCEMLRYMYTGVVNKLDDMASRLLGVAEKYQMEGLKSTCETALLKNLSLETVVEIFILSYKFGSTKFKNKVKEFIAAHSAVLGSTPEFQSALRMHPDLGIEVICAMNGNLSIV